MYYEDLLENVSITNEYRRAEDEKEERRLGKECEFSRNINGVFKGVFYKHVKGIYYSSGDIGSSIRYGLSGYATEFVVGSAEEDLFFVVKMATGDTYGPKKVFYNSPEEFEKNQYQELSVDLKNRWREKYECAKKAYELKQMKLETKRRVFVEVR